MPCIISFLPSCCLTVQCPLRSLGVGEPGDQLVWNSSTEPGRQGKLRSSTSQLNEIFFSSSPSLLRPLHVLVPQLPVDIDRRKKNYCESVMRLQDSKEPLSALAAFAIFARLLWLYVVTWPRCD